MGNKLWWHGIGGICREVHPTARIDIPDWSVGEFITEYLSKNGRCNRIIGEIPINGSVQFIGIPEIWGSGFPFIDNTRAPGAIRGRESTGSTNYFERWGSSIHISPTNSLRIPLWSRLVQNCICDYFLHHRRLERLWFLHNSRTDEQGRMIVRVNIWVCQRQKNRYIFVKILII